MTDPNQPQSNLREKVSQIIDGIRSYIQGDGGNIELVDVLADGTVKVKLSGACHGCPHAAMTLKAGVERTLKQHVPEVKEVVHVD